ncbi:hypothetical protein D0Z07_3627 [Hyphodiscus hymeniophilus]|uniref:RNA helicase HEL117 n=1 Tax=Hyphodiscus hymeniophilus TaxID=353542 RepID=A0A9P6VKE7_9HELO|nr:hypothetical protein D0Z07_3627 [Hyphodiscus hymeniophilus]
MADRATASSHHKRSRSRSPRRRDSSRLDSYRTRSPPHRHHQKRKHNHTDNIAPAVLPFHSRELTKRDYEAFKPMFALYLDIQKGKQLDELEEHEIRGRWKSFLGKWEEESESDDSVGPTLPGHDARSRRNRVGPSIPNLQDLELKREMAAEDGLAARDDIRYERKLDRKAQKTALDELVPRAEAGTRERQLEKKKEVNEKMRGFRERSPGAAEVPDTELMGGGDSIGDFKKVKQEAERKKTEREVRKEEILRARMAEREERMSEYRAKEDKTMDMLRSLAKQRFG